MRAILWDMDGTVLDSEPAHEAAFDGAVEELGLTLPAGFHDGLLGASGDQVHAALVRAGLALSFEAWTALKARHYAQHGGRITRRLPSAEIARALSAEGVPQALVSNSTAREVAMNLAVTGMEAVFAVIVSREDVAAGKPDPEGYLQAAARLSVAASDCLVIEDSLPGARAGRAAGMAVLWHPQKMTASAEDFRTLAPDDSPEPVIRHFLMGERSAPEA